MGPGEEAGPSIRVSGRSGTVRVGYQTAARLGAWTVTPGRSGTFTCAVRVEDVHAYWATQGPQDLVLALGPLRWTWSDVALDLGRRDVTVVLSGRPVITTVAGGERA